MRRSSSASAILAPHGLAPAAGLGISVPASATPTFTRRYSDAHDYPFRVAQPGVPEVHVDAPADEAAGGLGLGLDFQLLEEQRRRLSSGAGGMGMEMSGKFGLIAAGLPAVAEGMAYRASFSSLVEDLSGAVGAY